MRQLAGMKAGFPDDATLRRVHAKVLHFLAKRVPPGIDAQDVAAEVMLSFASFRGETSPDVYAWSVARKRLQGLQRERFRRPLESLDDHDEVTDPNPYPITNPLGVAWTEARAIGSPLSEVVCLWLAGLYPREIAKALALNPHTTRSRLARGREQLKARLLELALREPGAFLS